jgi:hypothetical protein
MDGGIRLCWARLRLEGFFLHSLGFDRSLSAGSFGYKSGVRDGGRQFGGFECEEQSRGRWECEREETYFDLRQQEMSFATCEKGTRMAINSIPG